MMFHHRVPRAPLQTAIETIWVYRQAPQPFALERILPTGAAQLIVNLKEDQTRAYSIEPPHLPTTSAGTVLAGVSSRHAVIDSAEQEHVVGVVFRPGGLAWCVGVPADETCNRDVPLEDLWGRQRTMQLRELVLACGDPAAVLDIVEAALLEAWRPDAGHPAVAWALDVFTRAPQLARIDQVVTSVGLSPKRFIERFRTQVGMTPKRFCRIRRFQRAVAQVHQGREPDWVQVALDCGYFDQAHFNHEFREFSGLTPGAFLARRGPFHNHVKFLQSDSVSS